VARSYEINPQYTKGLTSFLGIALIPDVLQYEQCVLTAASVNPENYTYTGSVYRMDGSLVVDSLRPSGVGHWRPVDPVTIDKLFPHLNHPFIEEAVFGGTFFSMWGHFLLETLSTAYAAQDFADIPVLFTEFAPSMAGEAIEPYWNLFLPILRAAGWTQLGLKLVKGPIKFGRLAVPQRLAVNDIPAWQEGLSPFIETTFEKIRKNLGTNEPPKLKVFAKRPDRHSRKHPAEQDLASILESEGFIVADLINMSPVSQVELFSKASIIAGFSGSNLHNSLFSTRGTRVFEIADSRSYHHSRSSANTNQICMCSVMGQSLNLIESYSFDEGEDLARPLAAFEIALEIKSALKY
jgi:hypothetical protein